MNLLRPPVQGLAAPPRAGALVRPRRLAPPVLALAASLLALLAAEAGLRVASRGALHVFDVEMWRYAHLVKVESPRAGVIEEHRPGAEAVLMGVPVRIDDLGLRRAGAATEAARRSGDRRVVALGDSVTFGWGVAEDRTWPATFEALLRERCPRAPVTVLNAGIGNSNTAMQLARYRELAPSLAAEWVVLGYFVNDAEPDPQPSGNHLVRHSALAATLVARLRQGASSELRDYRDFYGGLYADGEPGWQRTRSALEELGRRLAAEGVPATLLLLPEMHEPRGFGPFAAAYERVAAAGRRAGFEVVDASAAFPPGPGDRYFVSPDDSHPDAAAQRLFAEALLASRHACPASPSH
jgi:lysophospholipase L1-like esterase